MPVKFRFGDNWKDFSEAITDENYFEARRSLNELVPEISEKTFIDVGCGSGLFSVAASSLGASEVLGIDIDFASIEASIKNLVRFSLIDEDVKKDRIKFKQASVLDLQSESWHFDIVYSWGVLHHTGDMKAAFRAVSGMVNPDGLLVIAIYNKHFMSGFWRFVKRAYVSQRDMMKKIMVAFFYPIALMGKAVMTWQNPFKMRRGMTFYHDLVDWIGGYPYEYASIKEVETYFQNAGFKTEKINPTVNPFGCNEFVFRKVESKCAG